MGIQGLMELWGYRESLDGEVLEEAVGSQEVQGSQGTLVLQDHVGVQEVKASLERPERQDHEVKKVLTGCVALRGLRALRETEESLDLQELAGTSRHTAKLEQLEMLDPQV